MELRELEEKIKELINKYGRLATIDTFSSEIHVFDTRGNHVDIIKTS